MDNNDLIFHTDNSGTITSGGFKINSLLLKNGIKPIQHAGTRKGSGSQDHVLTIFSVDLAVPCGLLQQPHKFSSEKIYDEGPEDVETLHDNLHDSLLQILTNSTPTPTPKPKATTKKSNKSSSSKKITKKNIPYK